MLLLWKNYPTVLGILQKAKADSIFSGERFCMLWLMKELGFFNQKGTNGSIMSLQLNNHKLLNKNTSTYYKI